jgi:hypothetical protein
MIIGCQTETLHNYRGQPFVHDLQRGFYVARERHRTFGTFGALRRHLDTPEADRPSYPCTEQPKRVQPGEYTYRGFVLSRPAGRGAWSVWAGEVSEAWVCDCTTLKRAKSLIDGWYEYQYTGKALSERASSALALAAEKRS